MEFTRVGGGKRVYSGGGSGLNRHQHLGEIQEGDLAREHCVNNGVRITPNRAATGTDSL